MPELRPVFSLLDARDKILEAALATFAEFGFHGATMRDMAQRAGVSQGLLHHHFGGKEALWNLVGDRLSADFLAYVSDALNPAVVDETTIPRALRTYMNYWREHPAAFRFNLWRVLEGPKGEREARSEMLSSRIVPLIKRAQGAGVVRNDMPAGLALCIAGSLVQFRLHSQTEIRDALAVTGHASLDDEAFLNHVMTLLRTPPAARRTARRTRRRHSDKRTSQ
jgi:TetR/AcrR family transcriptional regulator